MKVILIHEDNHGLLGVAKDYESAINYLLQNQWLNTNIEIYVDDGDDFKAKSLKELNISIADIRKMDIDNFNELFNGIFYLDVDNVWGM